MAPTTPTAGAHLSPTPTAAAGGVGGNGPSEEAIDITSSSSSSSSSDMESHSGGAGKRPRHRRRVGRAEKRARVLAAVPPGFLEPLPSTRMPPPPLRAVTKQFGKDPAQHSGTKMERVSLLCPDIDSKHRAARLEESPGSVETLVTRTPKENWMIHPAWVQRLKWAGLLPFARLVEATRAEMVEGERRGSNSTRLQIDHSLLSCLVDRWRPETHTFHFRWGEMAPTLQDVSLLLGLPLAGDPIGPLQAPADWLAGMALRFQGIRDGAGPFTSEAHGPKLDWLLNYQIQKFGYTETQMTEPQITRSLEAYIMWLLGKVMFTENHVTTISARYIPIAVEIANATCADDITYRSWGSAVLAATYRGMCNGCQLVSPKSALLGCPILLQLWSWERFPIGRPDVTGEQPYPEHEVFDAEHIDMATFGTIWTRRKRRFAHDQVKNCYPSFNEQFDVLHSDAVIWEPYTSEAIDARYPSGMSTVCTRDYAYWMTKSKIIFDVCVEEMAQQRVMRQFGLRQLVDPPPTEDPLPLIVHMFTRKGSNRTATQWLQRVQTYVTEWETATARVWPLDALFDLDLFNGYLQRYMPATRLRIIQHSHPQEMPEPSTWDMYPSQSTSGSRQHAAELTQYLQAEFAAYGRSLSTGPLLLPRQQHQSWLRRMEEKLRSVYASITCTRTSDVDHHQASVRPPRPSTHQQHPRQPEPSHLRQHPRPHLAEQSTHRPPPPEQVGGSSWQQEQSSFDYWQQQQQQPTFQGGGSAWEQPGNFMFRPQTQPQGAYGHQSSLSEPSWASEQDHAQED